MDTHALVYTFRTFPDIAQLQAQFGEVFVFGSLREDMRRFKELIDRVQPDIILGVAKGRPSQFEPVAINRYGHNGTVVKNGTSSLLLSLPESLPPGFAVAAKPTHSFCNWTMYHIQSYLNQRGLATHFYFSHVQPDDVASLRLVINYVTAATQE